MLNLFDYFHSWNLQLVLFTVLMFLSLEIVGHTLSLLLRFPNFLRPVNWLIGLSLQILIWFVCHFFINFQSSHIVAFSVVPTIIALPFYVKHRGFQTLLNVVREHPWPFLISLPLFPIAYVKTSLPPYFFDEMAYQYMSPLDLKNITTWDFFPGGLYQNIPRLLNTSYYLIFSLTKTYVPARALHFMIMFTSFYSISLWLRKNVGLLASIFFVVLYFYMPIDLVIPATLGYIDIGAVCVIVLAILTQIDFLINKNKYSLIAAFFFWGLAAGIKYTSLIPLVSNTIVGVIYLFSSRVKLKQIVRPLIFAGFIFLLAGAYWELKNLVLFYNPIFPFIFPCKQGLASACQTSSGFFSGWTHPITFKEMPTIFKELMADSRGTIILFISSLILLFFQKDKKILRITFLVFGAILLEFLIMKKLSGFYIRYFQHVQILLVLFTSLQIGSSLSSYINKESRPLFLVFTLMFVFFTYRAFFRQVNYIYSAPYMPKYEVDYALGKTDLHDWINLKFPKMKDFIFFCNSVPGNKPFYYVNIDPDLIWFEYDGMMRVFMTNCVISGSPVDGFAVKDVVKDLLASKTSFYFTSVNPCTTPDKIRKLGYENPQQWYLRELTNELVCHSKQVIPNLYFFGNDKNNQ